MTDIVVVGGGHNGLVCAAYLAKAGRKVTVLEAADHVGGAAATREFAAGFRASCAHLLYMLDDEISRDLDLAAHGLQTAKSGLKTIALAQDGDHIAIGDDSVEGGGVSDRDQSGYREYRRFMTKFAGILSGLHNRVPPRITRTRKDLIALGKLALGIRMLGRDDMREFLRIAGINIYDVLKENFENPLLKGALSLDAVLGANAGPRSNNSVFTALHRLSGNSGDGISIAVGGMGAVTNALATAAAGCGADIRMGSPVSRILIENGAVSGVQLVDGERIAASTVVSNADPKTTIMDLLGARHVEAGFAKKISHIRARGNTAKLHLALDGLPGFRGVGTDRLGERLVIAPSVEYVERAFNHSKYGEFSAEPVAEITIPSVHDTSLAPEGQHVLSAIVQYAPRDLGAVSGGWAAGKAAFTERVMDVLSAYAPDIRARTVATELLTPEDMENEFRMAGGHWHHGEMSLDQFLMLRPVPGWAQYAMPVDGLYLCGAGCHPGGGIMGSAGKNAASAVLEHQE